MSYQPSAVKIVDVNKKGLSLDLATLSHVLLRDEIKDLPACVISIAGAFRDGKSFLLNFFIRYLTIASRERKDMTSWLNSKDGPVTGFSSKGGSTTVTNGILIWSEIFIVEHPSGQKMAVVLMDTQGSFDNETTMKSCAGIFAISTLVSSVQIYNLKNNIKSSDLENLQLFLGYGKLLKDSGSQYPFQNLLFLIRDWNYPEEYRYGMAGGNRLLQKVLRTDDPNGESELLTLRQGIKDLFEQICCYLLPYPGVKVTNYNFQGNLEDIDTDFKEFVETLAVTVLAPENLTPKVINGETIKVKNLVGLFQSYCHQFKSQEIQVESMYMATARAQCLAAVEEAEEMYDKEMTCFVQEPVDDASLLAKHRETKSNVSVFYNDKKIIDPELKGQGGVKLDEMLERKYKEYVYVNRISLERENMARLQAMFEEQKSQISDLEEQIQAERRMNEVINKMEKRLAELERDLENERTRNAELRRESESSFCAIL